MNGARLITIPFSHYCEKARWALDAAGVDYAEEKHAPIAHLRATRSVGGKTVPVFVDGPNVLRDSTDIAHHADRMARPGRRLLPEEGERRAQAVALEEELDETLGKDARLLAYWYRLRDRTASRALIERGFGARTPLMQRALTLLFRAVVFRRYRINRASAQKAETRVRETFAKMGGALAQGYLVGDRFTLADLTFAALASPLLGPPEHPVYGGSPVGPPPGLAALRAELAAMPAGQHALRMYREHRLP